MILKTIKDKLSEVDEHVFYAMVDLKMKDELWNYIVFNRNALKVSTNKTAYTDTFTVHIVREEWIPEGLDTEVINKMLEIEGMRLASSEAQYNYIQKPSTDMVVEMLSLEFVKPRKA